MPAYGKLVCIGRFAALRMRLNRTPLTPQLRTAKHNPHLKTFLTSSQCLRGACSSYALVLGV